MSEFINNKEKRQEVLKEIIMELHDGKDPSEVKERFASLIEGISASEISKMENDLVANGMPIEEIQRLCDVHASIFEGSIEEIHANDLTMEEQPGHPVQTLKRENRQIRNLIDKVILPHLEDENLNTEAKIYHLIKDFKDLLAIDRHYSRKENLIFPFMEKHDITAPPKVMWGVDDEIRKDLKNVVKNLEKNFFDSDVQSAIRTTVNKVKDMISKEENIMIPMVLEAFTLEDWIAIEESSEEIGFTLINRPVRWKVKKVDEKHENEFEDKNKFTEDEVLFDAGSMTPVEVNSLLNTLPIDLTFVDKNGSVKYFSQNKDRIFDRPKTILGRQVSNCHPPASVHIVEQIVADLESGKKDHEDFWIKMGPRFVYIRYFAVRDNHGEFLGTLEVTQDIKEISELKGEKRLMS